MSYDEFMLTYTDELCSPDFKLCVQEAISALSTNVDKSINITVRALYGAAACTIKTIGNKKKRLNNWLDQEYVQMKKSVNSAANSGEPIITEKQKDM